MKMFTSKVNTTKITQSMSFKTDQNYSRILLFGRNKLNMILVVKYTFLFSSFNSEISVWIYRYETWSDFVIDQTISAFLHAWQMIDILSLSTNKKFTFIYERKFKKKPRVFPQTLVYPSPNPQSPIPQGPLRRVYIFDWRRLVNIEKLVKKRKCQVRRGMEWNWPCSSDTPVDSLEMLRKSMISKQYCLGKIGRCCCGSFPVINDQNNALIICCNAFQLKFCSLL